MAKPKTESVTVTHISTLWNSILFVPLNGMLDSKRAQDVMEAMLTKIMDTQSKVIIMDIMGVATVDSAVANHILKITKATRLMGAECIISGISTSIAQTLVHLGVELGTVITRASIKDALELAFKTTGYEVREVREAAPKKKEVTAAA
jgi:rsbT co-antagonist protein RsbR